MTEHLYLVTSRLVSDFEGVVSRKDDIGLPFDPDANPSDVVVAARLTSVLLGLEPACTDVEDLAFTRIA